MTSTIHSLYRSHLRQIRALPHAYLKHFFRIKTSEDFRLISDTQNEARRERKLKRSKQELCKLVAANNKNIKAFNHILDLAYGRKGKLKWEIMEPLLSDPSALIPPRIIRSEPKSCSPVYSPELKALLTSGLSRTTKPLDRSDLIHPPILPSRAKPSSDEARLLGPFSKRREVNLRWRYFTREWKKVYPPLSLVSQDEKDAGGLRRFQFEGLSSVEEIEGLVGEPYSPVPPTKRERGLPRSTSKLKLPTRWFRRRYRQLLGRVPILNYSPRLSGGGNFTVSLSPCSESQKHRSPLQLPEATRVERSWLGE